MKFYDRLLFSCLLLGEQSIFFALFNLRNLSYLITGGTVKYYAQIHLQVWQNSVCTGQGNLPLIT